MNNEVAFISTFLFFLFLLSACSHFLYVEGYAMRIAQSLQNKVHDTSPSRDSHGKDSHDKNEREHHDTNHGH